MPSHLDDMKPYIIVYLHEDRVNKFKDFFYKKQGRQPNKREIGLFITTMIGSGNIDSEADEILKELHNKIISSNKTKNIIFNSALTAPLCYILISFIFILVNKELPDSFKSGGFYYTTFGGAIICLLVVLYNYVADIKHKK